MYKIQFTDQSVEDVSLIAVHIKYRLKNPESSEMIQRELFAKMRSLKDFPERFVKITINGQQFHRMPVNSFNVYYYVDKEHQTVTIARVLYSGMDINQVAIIN